MDLQSYQALDVGCHRTTRAIHYHSYREGGLMRLTVFTAGLRSAVRTVTSQLDSQSALLPPGCERVDFTPGRD